MTTQDRRAVTTSSEPTHLLIQSLVTAQKEPLPQAKAADGKRILSFQRETCLTWMQRSNKQAPVPRTPCLPNLRLPVTNNEAGGKPQKGDFYHRKLAGWEKVCTGFTLIKKRPAGWSPHVGRAWGFLWYSLVLLHSAAEPSVILTGLSTALEIPTEQSATATIGNRFTGSRLWPTCITKPKRYIIFATFWWFWNTSFSFQCWRKSIILMSVFHTHSTLVWTAAIAFLHQEHFLFANSVFTCSPL